MGLFDIVTAPFRAVGNIFDSRPGTTGYRAQGGIPGVGAMNPYQAQAPVIPVPSTMSLNAFQASAPTASAAWNPFQAQGAPLSEADYANAIQQAQGAQAGATPGVEAGRAGAMGTAGQMGGLADVLRAQMGGKGPSLAQLQLQQATQQNAQNAAAMIGSVRGINPAQAARGIAQQAATANQAAANQSAQIRMAEQLNAQQQLASALQAQGGLQLGAGQLALGQYGAGTQALGTAGGLQNAQNLARIQNIQQQNQYNQATAAQNAAMQTQTSLANAGFNLQAQGLNQMTGAQNAQLGLGYNQLMQQAYQQNAQNYLAAQGINAGIYGQNAQLAGQANAINAGIMQGNAQNENAFWGGLLNTGGGMFGAAALGGLLHEGGEVPEPEETESYAAGGTIHPIAQPGGLMEVPINVTTSMAGNQIAQRAALPDIIAAAARAGVGNAARIWGAGPSSGTTQSMAQGYADAMAANQAAIDQNPTKFQKLIAGLAQQQGTMGFTKPQTGGGGSYTRSPTGPIQQGATPAVPGSGVPGIPTGPVVGSAYTPQPFPPLADFSRFYAAQGGEAGVVPGSPRYPGEDREANDTVSAKLTPQEIVLPLSVTQHPNAPKLAADFVRRIKARGEGSGYHNVLRAKRALARCSGGRV